MTSKGRGLDQAVTDQTLDGGVIGPQVQTTEQKTPKHHGEEHGDQKHGHNLKTGHAREDTTPTVGRQLERRRVGFRRLRTVGASLNFPALALMLRADMMSGQPSPRALVPLAVDGAPLAPLDTCHYFFFRQRLQ